MTIQNVITELSPNSNDLSPDMSAKDIEFIMSSDLSDAIKEVRAAKASCEGNYACALALLQRVKLCGACIYAGFVEDRFKGTKGTLLSTLQSVKMLNGTAYGLVDSASTRNLSPQDRKST
ncbi:hypothetical protein DPX16_16259 [Anabarilius grahami]|uniref:Uncharacterized protein n=1 Tax=Anabarilius grahami TaxID=495550 RepID=A0A3N0XKY7_ANAGA|nr:hypothetical protein DPX16_16259 [Anabarilius grahami]